mmetsp:Transcript_3241/g.9397  ORF Transcript_3241/g.9397 Transcript_3241/m.9397 type:complete len:244 (+) Transcript_3241:1148-1879(+)
MEDAPAPTPRSGSHAPGATHASSGGPLKRGLRRKSPTPRRGGDGQGAGSLWWPPLLLPPPFLLHLLLQRPARPLLFLHLLPALQTHLLPPPNPHLPPWLQLSQPHLGPPRPWHRSPHELLQPPDSGRERRRQQGALRHRAWRRRVQWCPGAGRGGLRGLDPSIRALTGGWPSLARLAARRGRPFPVCIGPPAGGTGRTSRLPLRQEERRGAGGKQPAPRSWHPGPETGCGRAPGSGAPSPRDG